MSGLLRTVRPPEFAGVVFHEVLARSVLNRVPSSSSMPFGWTVNPYRGCTHACTYCLAGETPILLADGRTRPLADLRVGDRIYGTALHGGQRRYITTSVFAHWSTTRLAYRLTLADGTRLISSEDHRFLSDRGWRRVATRSGDPAVALVPGDQLFGTGQFATPPKESGEYRVGYLCGLIRCGDPGPYSHPHTSRPRIRLAVVGYEALARARAYLAAFGIATDRFPASSAAGRRQEALTIRTVRSGELDELGRLIAWPATPSEDWRRGFLAGVVDVSDSTVTADEELVVSSRDAQIVERAVTALRLLGFDVAVERVGDDGVARVRLNGGLAERLRFAHSIDPAIAGRRTIDGAAVDGGAWLRVEAVEDLGLRLPLFDITTGTGDFVANGVVSHNCFARNSHTYLELDAGADFDSQVVVKVNTPQVLAQQLRSPRWRREPVAMGTNTDPYQRAEGRYQLMPGVIRAFAAADTPFSVLTKGTLLARDLPLLIEAADRVPVNIGVSIAMLDRRLSASAEPGTPSPQARLELVRRISGAGLPCGVMVAPVLPCLTDGTDQLDALLAQIAAAGASWATVLALHLRPGAREWYRAWLAREYPQLAPRYDRIYARGSYADRAYRAWLARRVGPLVRRHGLGPSGRRGTPATGAVAHSTVSRPAGEQLTLL